MNISCYFRNSYINRLTSFFSSEDDLIIVIGQSGVGKSTIIDHTIDKLQIINNTVRYSYREDSESLKSFLNDTLTKSYNEDSFLKRIFNRNLSIEKVLVSPNKNLSLAYTKEDDKYKFNLLGKKLTNQISFESSPLKLNGGDYTKFFKKFWRIIKKTDCRLLYLSNLELALLNHNEIELIKAIAQTKPKHIKLILEIGNLTSNESEKEAFCRELQHYRGEKNLILEVNPFDKSIAEDFFHKIKDDYDISNYQYENSRGIPIAIVHDMNLIENKYKVNKVIDELINDKKYKQTLLYFTLMYGICSDFEELLQFAKDIDIKLDYKYLVKKDILRYKNNNIEFSHPLLFEYIQANYLSKISDIINLKIKKIKKLDRTLYYYLFLKYKKLLNKKFTKNEKKEVINILIESIDIYDMKIIDLFLPKALSYINDFNAKSKKILWLIKFQYEIYSFRLNLLVEHELISVNEQAILELLKLQSLYHNNDFEKTVKIGKKIVTDIDIYELDEQILPYYLAIINAIIGVSNIALGKYKLAKDQITLAKNISSKLNIDKAENNISNYLLLLDSFLFGFTYFEDIVDSDLNSFFNIKNKISNNYIKSKLFHNVFSAYLYNNSEDTNIENYFINTTIKPLNYMHSREVTYSLNNIAVYYLMNNDYDNAVDALLDVEDIAFEIYDLLSCYNNLIITYCLNDKFNDAIIYSNLAIKLIEDENFSDPSFKMKIYLNSAILYNLISNFKAMKKFLNLINISNDYDDFNLITKKVNQISLERLNKDNLFIDKEAKNIKEKYIFWPQLIHFWDFNIPIVNKYLLKNIH